MEEAHILDISEVQTAIKSSRNKYESVLVMVEFNRVRFSVAGEWFDTFGAALDHLQITQAQRISAKIAALEAEKAKLEASK